MSDPTEAVRRQMVAEINSVDHTREELEGLWGKGNVWSTDELSPSFEVLGFMAPFVVVRRKSDGVKGSMEFCHSPRFYYNFVEDRR
jgi:hypothetical protein